MAILLGTSVMLGMSALVVDVGQIYIEREELQSGADAAAAAVARTCVTSPTACDTGVEIDAIAEMFADLNAKDDKSDVAVCGVGWALPACQPEPQNLTRCVGSGRPDDHSTLFVEVRATTRTIGEKTVLPPAFSRTLAGKQNFDGTGVAACARVGLIPGDAPHAMVAPAVIVERCHWTEFTDSGSTYTTQERALLLKGADHTSDCGGLPSNGQNGPGNFGWLDHDGDCVSTLNGGEMYGGDPGANTESACAGLLDQYIDTARPMPLPLFDAYTGTGGNLQYHLIGFAALRITGYKLSGRSHPSSAAGDLCSGSQRCLYGYFVRATFPIISGGNPINYGATGIAGIKLTG